MQRSKKKIASSTIKNIISPHFPSTKNITKHDVFNIQVKLRKMMRTADANDSFEDFKAKFNRNAIFDDINEMCVTDDDACAVALDTWMSLMNNDEDDSLMSFTEKIQKVSHIRFFTMQRIM